MTQRGQKSWPRPHSQSKIDQQEELPEASRCHQALATEQRAEGHKTVQILAKVLCSQSHHLPTNPLAEPTQALHGPTLSR